MWDFPVQLIQTNETLKRTESLNLRNVSNFVSFVINFCCTQQHNNTTTFPTQHNNTTGLPTMPQIYHQPSPFLFLFKPFIRHRFWFSGPRSQTHAAVKSFELQQQKHIFNHCSRFNAISEQLRTLLEGKDDFMDPEVINFAFFLISRYIKIPPPPGHL